LRGARFDMRRSWLAACRSQMGQVPLDQYLRRLLGEVLSQPGFSFHNDFEAARIAARLISSAENFRRTLYRDFVGDWTAARQEYISLIEQRFLPALDVPSWQDDDSNAVLLSAAYTFLLRNRSVDYQFWVDVGSNDWWQRLEQPLTHPFVLRRDFPVDLPWTDDMEAEAQSAL